MHCLCPLWHHLRHGLLRRALLPVTVCLVALAACNGTTSGERKGADPTANAGKVAKRSKAPPTPAQRAIDRMLAEREEKGRPTIPGYRLLREAEEASERQARIINVIKARMRTALKHREHGKVQCLKRQLGELNKLHDRGLANLRAMERALHERKRDRAEELWLHARVADMQAKEHIHRGCTNEARVEVEMTAPGGVKKFSGSTKRLEPGSGN